jgi:hypothetical protein
MSKVGGRHFAHLWWRARERDGSRRASKKLRRDGCTWSKVGRGVGGGRGRGRGAGEPAGR